LTQEGAGVTEWERDVHLGDGRVLRVLEAGDLQGKPVFVLHGQPGSRLLYGRHVQDAARRGIRLIGHDRPGYGGSTRKPGRIIADEAADVRAIADELKIDQFAVWGHSAGGALALACAALLPDRVVAAASLAAVAPYPAEGLDWLEGMGEFNVTDFTMMMNDRTAWEAKSTEEAAAMANATVEDVAKFPASLLSDVDRKALTDEAAAFLTDQVKEGMRPGVGGSLDDQLSQVAPWGFELASIRVPLQYWHGRHDKFVPFSHGQWLAARLPGADIHLEPEDGHIALFTERIPSVHEWLVSHF
jgi:pimeloyl-ACP methyl ester carboxylesterase